MKKMVIFLVLTLCLCSCIACSDEDTKSKAQPVAITVIEEPLVTPVSTATAIDKTAELKQKSYEALKDLCEADFYNDDEDFDFVEFARAAGCSCTLSEDLKEIVIHPFNYNDEENFRIVINVDSLRRTINGDTIYVGKKGDEWRDTISHHSATDSTTGAVVDDYRMRIGFDELDYLWRQLRLLTAPKNKADEINAAIDDEIASYYMA